MCLVLGLILGHFTNSIQALLSSNIVQFNLGVYISIGNTFFNSSSKVIIGFFSLIEWDKSIYSASVVDRLILDYNLDVHKIGQPA